MTKLFVKCSPCTGTGFKFMQGLDICETCGGQGFVPVHPHIVIVVEGGVAELRGIAPDVDLTVDIIDVDDDGIVPDEFAMTRSERELRRILTDHFPEWYNFSWDACVEDCVSQICDIRINGETFTEEIEKMLLGDLERADIDLQNWHVWEVERDPQSD
jgi:hypothetical protein